MHDRRDWFTAVETKDYERVAVLQRRFQTSRDAAGDTALIIAVRNNDLKLIGMLAAAEAGIRGADGKTACALAIDNDSLRAFHLLQPFELPESVPSGTACSLPVSEEVYVHFAAARLRVLYHALTAGLLRTVQHVVENSAAWNDAYIRASLMIALVHGHHHIVGYLLHRAMDLNFLNGVDLYRVIDCPDAIGYPISGSGFEEAALLPIKDKIAVLRQKMTSLQEQYVAQLEFVPTMTSLNKDLDRSHAQADAREFDSLARTLQEDVQKILKENVALRKAIESTMEDGTQSLVQTSAELVSLREELDRSMEEVATLQVRLADSLRATEGVSADDCAGMDLGVGGNSDAVIELGRELTLVRNELEQRTREVNELTTQVHRLKHELRHYCPLEGQIRCFDSQELI
ncbi:hypothetical protein GMRT_13174 [Giardia muris]|uniref:Ankyrin repeat protein 1 n=1 Tax=Giardia muris TaxID=5742 RepID=A0A4Z1SSA8_GIAMU|nr:hypothetical protein GMRT_22297 [Giardia muris]TNJ28650.1 hypothetical protein GMRT_13174 [Giardia muris]|eukprot:TNJ28641.1 hypothetical protein GMRT_22297 [Giardia muris]